MTGSGTWGPRAEARRRRNRKPCAVCPARRARRGLRRRALALACTLSWTGAGLALPAAAGAGPPCRDLLGGRADPLDRELATGDLRLRWASSGPLAPPGAQGDGGGPPAAVKDLALQAATARRFFREALGLRDPLQSPRYRTAAAITILVMEPRGSGLAYDEVMALAPPDGGAPYCSLVIVVNRTRDFSRNATAAHEMFHLFQYGYGMFKTGWLLEGMARWSERFFTSRTPPPPAPGRCEDVTGRAYAAASWWAARWPLAAAAPSVRPLAAARYAGGAPVIPRLAGVAGGQVRADLERLARLSVQVSRRLGLPADAWPEQLQRASRHDRELCAALEQNRPSGAR